MAPHQERRQIFSLIYFFQIKLIYVILGSHSDCNSNSTTLITRTMLTTNKNININKHTQNKSANCQAKKTWNICQVTRGLVIVADGVITMTSMRKRTDKEVGKRWRWTRGQTNGRRHGCRRDPHTHIYTYVFIVVLMYLCRGCSVCYCQERLVASFFSV